MTTGEYTEHYKKYIPIYRDLAMVNGGKTVWIPTDKHDGWYISSIVDDEDSEAWKQGYTHQSRPSILPDDLSPDVDRTAYTTITYAPKESYKTKYYKKTKYGEDNQGYDWLDNDSQRLPDYGEMVAWALYVDIDIKKDYKERPLSQENKQVLENRLNLWVKAFTKMTGDIKHVQLLDSGGGVYVFTPPSVLSPIADEYNEEDRNLIYQEIGKRMRTVTEQLNKLICNADDDDKDIFSADKVQNKNRQFKTIGAIHKTIDAVVHPIDANNINIQHKKREDITDEDITRAHEWVQNFTSEEHEYCIENVIEYLFQGKFTKRDDIDIDYVEGLKWKDILDTWLEEKQSQIEMWQNSLEEQKELSTEQIQTEITQDKAVSREAIRRLNDNKLKKYIVDFVGQDNVYEKSNNEMDFFPFWRAGTTQSGRSAFYDYYEGGARFTDKSDGTSRGIVTWVALEMSYDDKNYPDTNIIDHPGDSLEGYEFVRVLSELRKKGEHIPIYVEKPEDGESLSEGKIIQIGKELDIINENDIVEISTDKNNRITEKLTPPAWNKVINRLDEEGIIHNCKPKEYIKGSDIEPDYDAFDMSKRTKSEIDSEFYIDEDDAWLLSEFEGTDEYIEFMDKLPEHLIAFKYNDKIKSGSANGILIGSVIADTTDKLIFNAIEPRAFERIDNLGSYDNFMITENIKLDKKNIKILL